MGSYSSDEVEPMDFDDDPIHGECLMKNTGRVGLAFASGRAPCV